MEITVVATGKKRPESLRHIFCELAANSLDYIIVSHVIE